MLGQNTNNELYFLYLKKTIFSIFKENNYISFQYFTWMRATRPCYLGLGEDSGVAQLLNDKEHLKDIQPGPQIKTNYFSFDQYKEEEQVSNHCLCMRFVRLMFMSVCCVLLKILLFILIQINLTKCNFSYNEIGRFLNIVTIFFIFFCYHYE